MAEPERGQLETGSYLASKGYNDRPKSCPDCEGLVYPTTGANVGRCSSCKQEFCWEDLLPAPVTFRIPAWD